MSQPIVHHLKTESRFYKDVISGKKPFEARIDDRTPQFAIGQILVLEETDSFGNRTGWHTSVEITYVLRGQQYGIMDGYAILGIKPVAR